MPDGVKVHELGRSLIPTYLFAKTYIVVALGQDGLVANAEYIGAQPLIGVNPDPARFDGVLLRFAPSTLGRALDRVIAGHATFRQVTLAEARLSDGQRPSSIFTMASGVAALTGGKGGPPITLGWEDEKLVWVVREPYVSKHSTARQTAGALSSGGVLRLESLMPSGGGVFSDGMEADSLQFNSGATVEVRPAEQRAQLVA